MPARDHAEHRRPAPGLRRSGGAGRSSSMATAPTRPACPAAPPRARRGPRRASRRRGEPPGLRGVRRDRQVGHHLLRPGDAGGGHAAGAGRWRSPATSSWPIGSSLVVYPAAALPGARQANGAAPRHRQPGADGARRGRGPRRSVARSGRCSNGFVSHAIEHRRAKARRPLALSGFPGFTTVLSSR